MRIEVYKDWIIRTRKGDKGYTLCKSAGFVERDGKMVEIYKDETYPNSITNCLRAIKKQELVDSKATTFKGFQAEVRKLEKLLQSIEKELGEEELLNRE